MRLEKPQEYLALTVNLFYFMAYASVKLYC